ncbi:MAG: FecR domain-containing protein [Polyangiaceae bacterium]
MGERLTPLRDLLREAARESDELASPRTARDASERALARWEQGRAPTRSKRARVARVAFAFAAAVALALGAVALVVGFREGPTEALTFATGPSATPGKVGAWLASPPEGLTLRFSEGTEIVLRGGTSARVARVDARGAELLLERGSLRASVVHRAPSTSWEVHAGPFEVHVVGTRFDAAWDPVTGTLDLQVLEGRVVVTGPLLDDGRAVASEERLRVSLRESRFEMERVPSAYAAATDDGSPAPPQEEAPAPSAAPAASPSAVAVEPARSGAASAHVAASAHPGSGWRELAREGRHRAAVDAAVAAGFDGVLGSASGADLLLLADSARFSGETARAKLALLAARKRGERGSSAFLLGKLAADAENAPADAARWFDTYLSESPGGALAEQALGRLIELRRRAGQTTEARAAAQKYLEKYPAGGYASAARSALASPPAP